ncbi:hypothetical protein ACHAXS_007896 [Conticribra weissflogii]
MVDWDQTKISWVDIAAHIDGRTAKQCRERWMNQLRPDLKKGDWTDEEDQLIHSLQRKLGNKWSKIAEFLPQRTDNDIKNRWHSFKRQQLRRFSGKSKKIRTTERGFVTETAKSLRKYPESQLTPGYTPIRHDDIESILLENAALSLSSMKSNEREIVDLKACEKENSPPLKTILQGCAESGCKTIIYSQKRNSKSNWVSADFASPSKFRWNNVTPCSSRVLASLPLCESGPFINSQTLMERSNLTPQSYSHVMIVRRNHSTSKTDGPRTAPGLANPLHLPNSQDTKEEPKVVSNVDNLNIIRVRGSPITNSYQWDQHDKQKISRVHTSINEEQLDKVLPIQITSLSAECDEAAFLGFSDFNEVSIEDTEESLNLMPLVNLSTNHQLDGSPWSSPSLSQPASNGLDITTTQQNHKEENQFKSISSSNASRPAEYEGGAMDELQSLEEEPVVLSPVFLSSENCQNDPELSYGFTTSNRKAGRNNTPAICHNQTHGASTSEE